MKTEDMPLFARLLAQHGIDPRLIPMRATFEIVQNERRQGVIVDTVVPDPDGAPYGLLDVDGADVTYRKFYPEPEELS